MKKSLALSLAILALLVSGCTSDSSADLSPNNPEITQVIDVRTAAEFAAGHVAGAINFDVEAGDFEGQIATLDSSGVYLVYCRSGRRSAIAAATMEAAGLSVLDGGAFDSMLANGWTQGP